MNDRVGIYIKVLVKKYQETTIEQYITNKLNYFIKGNY